MLVSFFITYYSTLLVIQERIDIKFHDINIKNINLSVSYTSYLELTVEKLFKKKIKNYKKEFLNENSLLRNLIKDILQKQIVFNQSKKIKYYGKIITFNDYFQKKYHVTFSKKINNKKTFYGNIKRIKKYDIILDIYFNIIAKSESITCNIKSNYNLNIKKINKWFFTNKNISLFKDDKEIIKNKLIREFNKIKIPIFKKDIQLIKNYNRWDIQFYGVGLEIDFNGKLIKFNKNTHKDFSKISILYNCSREKSFIFY